MASNKAPGIDKIQIRVIEECLSAILSSITSIINTFLLTASCSSAWRDVEVTPVPKDGDYEIRLAIIDIYFFASIVLCESKVR